MTLRIYNLGFEHTYVWSFSFVVKFIEVITQIESQDYISKFINYKLYIEKGHKAFFL